MARGPGRHAVVAWVHGRSPSRALGRLPSLRDRRRGREPVSCGLPCGCLRWSWGKRSLGDQVANPAARAEQKRRLLGVDHDNGLVVERSGHGLVTRKVASRVDFLRLLESRVFSSECARLEKRGGRIIRDAGAARRLCGPRFPLPTNAEPHAVRRLSCRSPRRLSCADVYSLGSCSLPCSSQAPPSRKWGSRSARTRSSTTTARTALACPRRVSCGLCWATPPR